MAAVADDLAAEEVRKTLEISELDDAIQGKVLPFFRRLPRFDLITLKFIARVHKILKIWGLNPRSQRSKI